MRKFMCIMLTFALIFGLSATAYASPDPTWASLPVQKQGGATNEAKYTKAVQRLLMNCNRYTNAYIYDENLAGCGIDGSFGTMTDLAVRFYQMSAGLTSDGSVGPATWASLRSNAIIYGSSNTDFNYYVSGFYTDCTYITIRQGRSTGNWGSRPWGVADITNAASWNVFNS